MRYPLLLALFIVGVSTTAVAQNDRPNAADANHRFITLAIHGYSPGEGGLYSSARSYFNSDAWSELGPDGVGYTNISAFHLSNVATSTGADFVRQIGDFNLAADDETFDRGVDRDAGKSSGIELGANGQPFISLAKLEWTYRNTAEFLDNLSWIGTNGSETTDGPLLLRQYVDYLMTKGPQYRQLLALGPAALVPQVISYLDIPGNTLDGAVAVFGSQLNLDSTKLGLYLNKPMLNGSLAYKWKGASNEGTEADVKRLMVALWLSAWQAPNTIRMVGHSMGGTDILRYLSETYDANSFNPDKPVGLYNRNQNYRFDFEFQQDRVQLAKPSLHPQSGNSLVQDLDAWYPAKTDSERNLLLFEILKKERQNSVDKVIILDSPLAGTPMTDPIQTGSDITDILHDWRAYTDFENTVIAAVAVNIFVASIELAFGTALAAVPGFQLVAAVLIADAYNQFLWDGIFLGAMIALSWDAEKDRLTFFGAPVPAASFIIDIKPTDKFFHDTKIGSSHVQSYANAPPPTRFSDWEGMRSHNPIEIQNVVVSGPLTYTRPHGAVHYSTLQSVFLSIASGNAQRGLFLQVFLGKVVMSTYLVLISSLAEDINPNGASYIEPLLGVLWFMMGTDYEPGTLVTAQSYSSGLGAASVGPIANNPLAAVYNLRVSTEDWAKSRDWYGAGFPVRHYEDADPSQPSWHDQIETFDMSSKFFGLHLWDAKLLSYSIIAKDESKVLIREMNGVIAAPSYSLRVMKSSSVTNAESLPLDKSAVLRGRSFYDYFMFGPQDQTTDRSVLLSTEAKFGNIVSVMEDGVGDPLKGLKSAYLVTGASGVNPGPVQGLSAGSTVRSDGTRSYLKGVSAAVFNNVVQVLPISLVNYFTGVTSAFSINGAAFQPGEVFQATPLWPTLEDLGKHYENNPSPTARLVLDAATGNALLIGPHFKEGFNQVAFRITDQMGGSTLRDLPILQVTVPPFVKPVFPLMNQYVDGSTVHASVQALDIGGGSIKPSDWLQTAVFDIRVDGQVVQGARVDIVGDGGTVGFDLSGLADGNHTIDFKVSTYGVENTQSWRFWVDSSAPAVVVGDPVVFTNADKINKGNVGASVQDTVPFRLGGADYPVDTVQLSGLTISVAGQTIYSGNNVRLGNYIQPWNGWNGASPLPTGRYPVSVVATDRVGNTSTTTGEVIVDNKAPVLQTAALNTSLVTRSTGLLSLDYQFGLDDWETSATLNIGLTNRVTNEQFNLSTLVGSQEPANYTLTYFSEGVNSLRDGVYDIAVTAVDEVGNTSSPRLFTGIVIDRTAPVLSNVYGTPFELTTPQSHVDVFVTASESKDVDSNLSALLGLEIKLTDTNGTPVATFPTYTAGIGSMSTTQVGFNLPTGLADGKYLFQVSVTDAHGNASVEYVPVIINAVPPEFTSPAANALIDGVTTLYGNVSVPHFSSGLGLHHYELHYHDGSVSLPANLQNLTASGWSRNGLAVPSYQSNPAWSSNWGRFTVQGGEILGSLDTTQIPDGLITLLAVAVDAGGYRIGTVRTFRVLHGAVNELVEVQIPSSGLVLDVTQTPQPASLSIPYSIEHATSNPVDVYTAVVDASGNVVKQDIFHKLYSTQIVGRPSSTAGTGLYVFESSDGAFHLIFNNPGPGSLVQVVTINGTNIHSVTNGQNQPLTNVSLSTDGKQLVIARSLAVGASQEVVFKVEPGTAIQLLDATESSDARVFVGSSAQPKPALIPLALYQGSDYPSFLWDGTDALGRYVRNGTYTAIVEAYGELGGHDVKTVPIQLTTPFVIDQVSLDTHNVQLGVGALSVVNGVFRASKAASVQVFVTDASGTVVATVPVPASPLLNPGVAGFSWNATDSSGGLVPLGLYSFRIVAVPDDSSTASTFDAGSIPALGNVRVSLGVQLDAGLPASVRIEGESSHQGVPVTSGSNDYTVKVTPTGQYLPDTTATVGFTPRGTQIVQAFPQMNYMTALRKNYSELWARLAVTGAKIQAWYPGWFGVNDNRWFDVTVDSGNTADIKIVTYNVDSPASLTKPTTRVSISFTGHADVSGGHWAKYGSLFGADLTTWAGFDHYASPTVTSKAFVLGSTKVIATPVSVSLGSSGTPNWTNGSDQRQTIRMTAVFDVVSDMSLGDYLSYADGIHVMGPDATIAADKTAYVAATSSKTYQIFESDSKLNPAFLPNSDSIATIWRKNPTYYFYYIGEDYANVTEATGLKPTYGPGAANYAIGKQGQGAVGRITLATTQMPTSGIPAQTASHGKVEFVFSPAQGTFTVSSSAEDRILYPFPETSLATLTAPHVISDSSLGIPLLNINGQRTNATPNFAVPALRLNSSTQNVAFANPAYNTLVTEPLVYDSVNGYQSAFPLTDINAASNGVLPIGVNVKQWKVASVRDFENRFTFSGVVGTTIANDAAVAPPLKILDSHIVTVTGSAWDLTKDPLVEAASLVAPLQTPDLDSLNRYGKVGTLYFSDVYPFRSTASNNPMGMFSGSAGAKQDNLDVVIPALRDYSLSSSTLGYGISILGTDGKPYQGLAAQTPATFGKGQKLSDGVTIALTDKAIRALLPIYGQATAVFELSYLSATGNWVEIPIVSRDQSAGILTYWDVTALSGVQTLRLISHGPNTANVAFAKLYIGSQVVDSAEGSSVESPSGKAKVIFPQGTLSAPTVISVEALDYQDIKDVAVLPAYAPLGKIVKLGPEGTTFPNAKPLLQFTYNKADIDALGIDPLQLRIYQLKTDGTLLALPSVIVYMKVAFNANGDMVSEEPVWQAGVQSPDQVVDLDYTYVRVYSTLDHFSYYAVYEGDLNRRPAFDQADFVTKKTVIDVSGTGQPLSSVRLFVLPKPSINLSAPGLMPSQTTTSDASGRFVFSDIGLITEGDNYLFAAYGDAEGGQYSKIKIVRDTTAPILTLGDYQAALSPNFDGKQDSTVIPVGASETVRVRWQVSDVRGVTVLNGAKDAFGGAETFIPWDGTNAAGQVLGDGSYTMTVIASDSIGNDSPSRTLPFVLETTPPQMLFQVPPTRFSPANQDGYADSVQIPFSLTKSASVSLWLGTIENPKGIQLLDSAATPAGNSTLVWNGRSSEAFVPDDSYLISSEFTDAFGNSNVAFGASALEVDNTPTLVIPSVQTGDAFVIPAGARFTFDLGNAATVSLKITDSLGVVVLNRTTAMVSGSNLVAWDTTSLAQGHYLIEVEAVDDLRNISTIIPVDVFLRANADPPIILLQDTVEVEATGPTTAFVLPEPDVSGELSPISVTNDAPATYPYGTTTVTWKATDPYGISSSKTQKVVVTDTTPPTFTKLPSAVTVETTSVHTFVDVGSLASGAVGVSDIFPVSVVNNSPGEFFQGDTDVTWTLTDSNGNVSRGTQVITVKRPATDTFSGPWYHEDLGKVVGGGASYDGSKFVSQGIGHGVFAQNQTQFILKIDSNWGAGYTGKFILTNTSGTPINGWTLNFSLPQGTTLGSAWNGSASQANGVVTIKSMSYNALIPLNGSVEIGFQMNGPGVPGGVKVNGVLSEEALKTAVTTRNQTRVSISKSSDWGTGYNGNLTITNISNVAIGGWTVVFQFPGAEQLVQSWNGASTQSGRTVTITNADNNKTIGSMESISLGFQVQGSGLPGTAVLVNGIEAADARVLPDQTHFQYQKITGDTTIVVRVLDFSPNDVGAQAVLMLRDTLTSESKMVSVSASLQRHPTDATKTETRVVSAWRSDSYGTSGSLSQYGGGMTANGVGVALAKPYLRLSRTGSTVVVSASSDGIAWQQIGAPIIMTSTGPDYVGFGVRTTTAGSAVQITNAEVTTPHSASGVLTGGWSHQDLGGVTQPGWATLTGTTANVYGNASGSLVPGLVQVRVVQDSVWQAGYTGRIRVTNVSPAAIDGWSLSMKLPGGSSVSNLWNGSYTQNGTSVVVLNSGVNKRIEPNATVEFGFQINGSSIPFQFTLNGIPAAETPPLLGTNITSSSLAMGSPTTGGYTAVLRMRNLSAFAIDAWTLTFDFPGTEQLQSFAGLPFTQTGSRVSVSVTNQSWAAGDSLEFPFTVSGGQLPGSIAVNGAASRNAMLVPDSYHFVSTTGSGNVTLMGTIDPSQIGAGSQVLLAIRQQASPESPMATVSVARVGQQLRAYLAFRDQVGTGYSGTPVLLPGGGTSLVLKLVGTGNVFTGYVSADGVTWTQVGSPYVGFSLTTYVAGLGVNIRQSLPDSKYTVRDLTVAKE